MKKTILTLLTFAGIGTLSLLYAQTNTAANENESATAAQTASVFQLETKDQESSAASRGLTVTKKFSRRLPQHYGSVATSEQREKIYKIQQSYFGLIELLTLRIEKLVAERDSQIEAVLTQEQKEKVEALKKNSAGKRRNPLVRQNQ
jgi:Spy/CpxP family protein refolding chaperone